MPTVAKAEAVERLAQAISQAGDDDLAEIYTELHPERPAPAAAATTKESLVRELLEDVHRGIEAEEIVDLWNVVFPQDWDVWYDEEEAVFRYNEAEPRYAG